MPSENGARPCTHKAPSSARDSWRLGFAFCMSMMWQYGLTNIIKQAMASGSCAFECFQLKLGVLGSTAPPLPLHPHAHTRACAIYQARYRHAYAAGALSGVSEAIAFSPFQVIKKIRKARALAPGWFQPVHRCLGTHGCLHFLEISVLAFSIHATSSSAYSVFSTFCIVMTRVKHVSEKAQERVKEAPERLISSLSDKCSILST
eukprot:1156675-Pelagomonas_calceolata.AAC.2